MSVGHQLICFLPIDYISQYFKGQKTLAMSFKESQKPILMTGLI